MLQGDYVEKWYEKLLKVISIKAVKCILPLVFDSSSCIYIYIYIYIFDKISGLVFSEATTPCEVIIQGGKILLISTIYEFLGGCKFSCVTDDLLY